MDAVQNRFMFDTNALDKICADSRHEMMIYSSKGNGFDYYFSEIQCTECVATIKKTPNSENALSIERKRAKHAANLLRVIPKLQSKYVAKIATLLPNKTILDGTFKFMPGGEDLAFKMFRDIFNNNDNYYNDAMIAMTAIVNGCTLVTEDVRLHKKVNAHFYGRAIRYHDFFSILEEAHL